MTIMRSIIAFDLQLPLWDHGILPLSPQKQEKSGIYAMAFL
jgi:hypothetical protein